MAITLPITSRTSSDDNDFADVYGNDSQLVTEIDARDSVYKEILSASALISDAFSLGGTVALSGGGVIASGVAVPSSSDSSLSLFRFDDADYSVSSKTQKLRLRAQVAANATAEAGTFTFGLYPVTVAGGADNITFTLGTVVTGSTVALAAPATSTITPGDSGDFTIPADGNYCLGCVIPAIDSGAMRNLSAQLQTRHT